jgi:exo-rhamnogalacturonan lyase-like protein
VTVLDPTGTPIVIAEPRACAGRTFQHEPVTFGVPFPRGLLAGASALALFDEAGRPVPLQVQPAELWPDGTLRWALLDFQVAGATPMRREYRLAFDAPASAGREADRRITTAVSQTGIEVDTGVARFRIAEGAGSLAGVGAVTVTDEAGCAWPLQVRRVTLEETGHLRCTVRLDGTAGPSTDPLVNVLVRVQLFAGSATTRVAITLHNPRRAEHPGGFWELGDSGSVYLRDVAVAVSAAGAGSSARVPAQPRTRLHFAAEVLDPIVEADTPLVLYQDSSGGEQWMSSSHVNRRGEIPLTFRGYAIGGAASRAGLRATPVAVLADGAARIGLAVEQFWQNFPKAIEASADGLILRLWPQKTHHFVVIAGDDPMALDAVYWGRTRARASVTPEWYCAAGAIRHLTPAAAGGDHRYTRLVAAAIEGPDSFDAKRERVDEYGWRDFGDLYADHENASSGESGPIISHYNNQYDGIAGCVAQFMRSGDSRWWTLMQDLAAHVADIDVYHTDRDKAAYNHGLFWHTFHYVPAGRSTHRSYPRHPRVWGGGPGNEHNYASGLRLHWLLTGDRQSRDAAVGLAQWVIDMDDGRRTVLRWLSRAPTGLASATHSAEYHGPGRGAGHSILALLDGHRLTGEARFLAKAEVLVRRCIHPGDDIAARELLDAERRWSYVVFLQALGKYLEYKEELGQDDGPSAYGRAALLHYAQWMAGHEYPYLEKPEILEYPTETWAAQDMRKCEVFLLASRYAAGELRARLLERADYFFAASVSTLEGSATRTCTRPLVLLLSNGFMYLGFDRGSAAAAPAAGAPAFPAPAPFVPQKIAAKKRLLAGAAVCVLLVLLAALVVLL